MIAVKRVTPNMPRLETVNVPPPSSGGVIDAVAHPPGQRARLAGDLAERLLVGVEHRRHDERGARRPSPSPRPPPRRSRASAAAAARRGSCRSRVGYSRSASAHAFTTMSLYVGASAWPSDFNSARSATHASMSISVCSVNSGIVAFASAIRRAIVCWVRVSSRIVVSPLAVLTRRRSALAGGATAAGATPRRWRCTGAPPGRRVHGGETPAVAGRRRRPRRRPSRSAARPLPSACSNRLLLRAIRRATGTPRRSLPCLPAPRTSAKRQPERLRRASPPRARRPAGRPAHRRFWSLSRPSRQRRRLPSPTCAIGAPTGSVSPSAASDPQTPSWSDS